MILYIGPGLATGTIILTLVILALILFALYNVLAYPIKMFFAKRKKAKKND